MAEHDPKSRKQDPRVERLRPDPSKPAPRTRALEGLWGDSDRTGFARLYLTRDLSVYAEFLVEDVIVTTEIPADRAPFVGEQATHVELPHDANVDITHSKVAGDLDEFDLDVRFGTAARYASVGFASSGPNECTKAEDDTDFPCGHTCDPFLCKTFIGRGGGQCPRGGRGGDSAQCVTDTCNTCDTNCGTCNTDVGNTNCGTCDTDFGQTNCGGCERRRR
jgi:hypothetical protein